METIKKQIEYQKFVLKEWTEKLDKTIIIENGKIINEKIKTHQEFLESLYNILKKITNNNIEENINKLNLPKDKEKQINIKEKNFEKEDKKNENNEIIQRNKILNNQEEKKNISKSCDKSKKKKIEIYLDNSEPMKVKSFTFYFKKKI